MVVVVTMLLTLLVVAMVALAIWMWLFLDIFEQVTELMRIRIQEQIAIWRIESIAHIAQLEQEQLRSNHTPKED